jgi:hypothetical protein
MLEKTWVRVSALLAVACVVGLAAGNAFAQTASDEIKIDWTLPTFGCTRGISPCDRIPLTGDNAITQVNVYVSTSPIPDQPNTDSAIILGPGVTTAKHTVSVRNGDTIYVRLSVTNSDGTSPLSNVVTRPVDLPVIPGVPTNVTITLTIG